ncbi:MAG: hypothetical protein M3Y87_16255 [Myxococcota bacterium]|nr:hypothetical protein [Myxococcota bacterium]
MHQRIHSAATAALALALIASGCSDDLDDLATERAALFFTTTEGGLSRTMPIAVGARAALAAEGLRSFTMLPVLEATSRSPDVIAVREIVDGVAMLEALAPGEALIDVTVRHGEEVMRETTLVEARAPASVVLGHACEEGDDAVYLTRSALDLSYGVESADGTELVGFGFFPIEVTPAESADVLGEPFPTQRLPVITSDATGPVTLSSQLGGDMLVLDVVSPSDVGELGFVDDRATDELQVGTLRMLELRAQADYERPVCLDALRARIEVLTPEVCNVFDPNERSDADLEPADATRWLTVEGLTAGTCRFTTRFGGFVDGQDGIREIFTILVR